MRQFVLVVLALMVTASSAIAQRLPSGVTPTNYTLWFAPDLERATFRGRETIDVTLQRPTTTITLNAAEIDFGDVSIEAGGRRQTATVTLNEKNEMATLTVPQAVPAGRASIQITYTGMLNDKLRGFYLSKANGRRYAVTQMEATDARRAFPSWDEPAYKATFDLSLMIDSADTAISNGAQTSDTAGPDAGKHTLVFARTPKMSTYLVAMLVGDFVCRSGSADNIPIRVCSTPDKLPLTGFALEATQQVLKFYNEWTGIKYAFGKLDIIGVPDFAAGAMENVGAITFREEDLFADPERASLGTRKTVASVVSHEVAHQWFGNLVTMKWWDDIWLNEGFATWMATKPLAAWHPEWQVDLDEVEERQTAMSTDALRSTRPIRTKVETPDEINEVFDRIAYEKTASVLRTIENYVGPEVFRKGVGSYLRKYSFANAAGEDFWNEVTRATGKPVDRIMKPFIEQAGVPVVAIDSKCQGSVTRATLHQERFVALGGASPSSSPLWAIPVCFKTPGAQQCNLLERRDERASLSACAMNVFGNANGRGYYFSQYPPETAPTIARTARPSLTPTERLTLLGDEWWMTRAGRHDVGVYFDIASLHGSDETPSVIEQIGRSLGTAHDAIVQPSDAPRFEEWVRRRFGPELMTLGLPGSASDSDDRQSRRATLLALVGVTGNSPDVQRATRDLAMKYIADPMSVPPTLASTALAVAAYGGDAMLYDLYMAQLPKLTGQPEQYYRFFNALPSFRDPALVQRTLRFAISTDVRTQDTASLIGGLISRTSSQDAAWAFVKENWDTLTRTLGIFQGIPRIAGAVGAFCSREKRAEVEQFFKAHPVPAAERTLRQAFERIDSCVAVRERQAPAASSWLASAAR
ncbi:MAG TPA: M1 family aminopeptidase [Vicinamibacterales bacterium]|nr:M1 family aminopeptidase [Vicinamibacterales bacterium]